MQASTITALIVGYYGAGNAGDEAILEAMLGDLRARIPSLRPIVVSENPTSTAALHGIESIPNNDRLSVLAAIKRCDLVILGGGGLFQDSWDVSLSSVFSRPVAPLSYYFYSALAALYEKPMVLFAIGVGPLSTEIGRLYTRMASELAALIIVRDEGSKAAVLKLGVDADLVHVTADPAFLLSHTLPIVDSQRPIVAVALRNWTLGVDPGQWETEIATALDNFLARHGGTVLFLPFQQSSVEAHNDTAVALRVQSRMTHRERTGLLEAAGDWRQLAGAIGCADLVLGMRYHSALFAIRQGVPVAGLAYDPKVHYLIASAGCEQCAVDLNGMHAESLLETLEGTLVDPALQGKLISASEKLSAAAAESGRRLSETLSRGMLRAPDAATVRWWLDELAAAVASIERQDLSWITEVKQAIAERRSTLQRGFGQSGPYDVICFPGIEWDLRRMRPQQLMAQFANHGHRVFFVSPTKFLPMGSPKFTMRALRKNVWEVRLATPYALDVYSGLMAEEVEDSIVEDIQTLAGELEIDRAVSILHLPTWATACYRLRSRLGWPLAYDCMDDWSGFAYMPDVLLGKEPSLVQSSDLVVVTAQKLWDKWAPLSHNTLLVPNAADFTHFQQGTTGEIPAGLPSSMPVAGFFGVVDSWFDVELVRRAAGERPQYFFALVGAVYDAPVDRLEGLANVRLFGHQSYDLLPSYLRRFDVCMIPFKVNSVTLSTDPVKFYEYLSQGKPIVSTRLPQLEPYGDVTYLANDFADFVRLLDQAIAENDPDLVERRRKLARGNSWAARYDLVSPAIQQTFAVDRARPNILFVYQFLGLGGVEVVLQARAAELSRRGYSIRIVFLEEADGRALFERSGIDFRICGTETELADQLSGFRPDWIISIDTPAILPLARRTCPEAGLVYEVHSSNSQMLAPLTGPDFFTGIRGILVPSASQGQRIQPLMAADVRIEVIPNALSPAFFETGDDVKAASHPIVLWVGRLDAVKNWRGFLGIARRLRDRTNAQFHLISGRLSAEAAATLSATIGALGLEARVRSTQTIPNSRMPEIYRASARSGGCLVSTSATESFGMVALEAMACGCPVVAPDIVGLRDLVRHSETGRLYPAGDLATACEQIVDLFNETPERRRMVTDHARELAIGFSPERAADRFLAVLEDWSAPREPKPQPALASTREFARILADTGEGARVVIFPPFLPWRAELDMGRTQRWAKLFARVGCLVFYCDPQRHIAGEDGFVEVENRLFLANTPMNVYEGIEAPAVIACGSNLDQLCHFRNPLVVYECLDALRDNGSALSDLEAEWLARAAVVTVSSEDRRSSVARLRPDVMVVSDSQLLRDDEGAKILSALESARTPNHDPIRLQTLLAWREREVNALRKQIQARDRPAVEILQGAIEEQKRILLERDTGVAFLRNEVAARNEIIAERNRAVEFLKNEVGHRETELARLRSDIESRGEIIRERQDAIQFLQKEIATQKEGITFLRGEISRSEAVISERQRAIEFLQQEVAARDAAAAAQLEGIAFLRGEVAQLEAVISERQRAIEFLQQEVAARDAVAAAQLDGIAFLRGEVAQREAMIAERERQLLESTAEIARLSDTVRDLEATLPWLRRWLLGRSRREGV